MAEIGPEILKSEVLDLMPLVFPFTLLLWVAWVLHEEK